MKSCIACLLAVLALAELVAAAGPQLLVRTGRGQGAPLNVAEVSIGVTLTGDVAETTILVGFQNDTSRNLEGDFVMPLPPGATVSSYALEVNGAMREGVAVEKERARVAYESIKRQNIDPGYVEREANNVYRTKIFPILPNSVKRVRLGYVEHLKTVDGKLRYELPCQFSVPVANFSCRIQSHGGTTFELKGDLGLSFAEKSEDLFTAEAADKVIEGTLALDVSLPKKPALMVESVSNERFFYLADVAPAELVIPARPEPKSVLLVWDASESRQLHASELAALEAWFQLIRNTEVRLQILRNVIQEAGTFTVRDGNWQTLKNEIEKVYYDGSTSLDKLAVNGFKEDVMVVCTDAVSPFGLPTVSPGKPVFLLNGSGNPIPPRWIRFARESGGAAIDINRDNPRAAVDMLTRYHLRIISVRGSGIGSCHFDRLAVAGKITGISGRLKPWSSGGLKVSYGYGKKVRKTRSFSIESGRNVKGGIVRRIWAQAALKTLEYTPAPSEKKITAHCKQFGLVSDFTSLIVLERFEDHLRYEIPPPEADLRNRYDLAIAKKKSQDDGKTGLARLKYPWQDKTRWHKRDYPWSEVVLLPRLRQVSIWTRAVSTVFREEDLDGTSFNTIDGWRQQALEVIKRRERLTTEKEYQQWERDVAKAIESGGKLRQTPLTLPEANKALVVSVRGLVKQPGNVSGPHELTLRQAIARAGGISALGSNTNVELYRNAGKKVYNLGNTEFRDIPLMPGDMIVVAQEYDPYDHWGNVDPFADGGASSRRLEARAPVVTDTDLWVSPSSDTDPFGGAGDGRPVSLGAGGGGSPSANLTSTVRIGRPEGTSDAALAGFALALENGTDPVAAYRAIRKNGPQLPEFYVNAARFLSGHGHQVLAEQALSNFLETPELDLGRALANAMWLVEVDRPAAAITLLNHLRNIMPSGILPSYHRALIDMQRKAQPVQSMPLTQVIQHGYTEHAVIALTDFNGLVALKRVDQTDEIPYYLRNNLDADIRIVVTASDPDHSPSVIVKEPSGESCRASSSCGGRLRSAPGISEYMMRRAMPGRYTLTCQSPRPMTVHAILYGNWGRPNQSHKAVTVLVDGNNKPVTLADYDFAFQE